MRNGQYTLIVAPDGYPGKRYRDRYAYEHSVVFWQTHGYVPPKGRLVHHKNENKTDNSPDNLEDKAIGKHSADHHVKAAYVDLNCGWCGQAFKRLQRNYKFHAKLRNKFFCTARCGAKHQHSVRRPAI